MTKVTELEVAKDLFADRHQAACAGFLLDRQLGNAPQAGILKVRANAICSERRDVPDDATFTGLEDLFEVIDAQRVADHAHRGGR